MDLLVAALILALGFLLGVGFGAARAFRLAAQQRAARGANAALARFWPEQMPNRSAADILAGRIRIVLGGSVYDLPVLPRGASRRWIESLDARFHSLAGAMDAAGDDTPQIIALLLSQSDGLYEMLLTYDQSGVLPPRDEIDEQATDIEILRAVLEVWRAANPLAATLAGMETDEPPTNGSSPELPSTPPSPTAGGLTTSTSS